MPTIDPRTKGFNYGSPLQGRNPPFYQTAVKIAERLAAQAEEISAKAWELEMAIKDVRIACNREEKAMALAELEKELTKHIRQKGV